MPFITQGKTNLKYILIVVILAAIVGGGILAWQYWWMPGGEKPLKDMPPPTEDKFDSAKIENLISFTDSRGVEKKVFRYNTFNEDKRKFIYITDEGLTWSSAIEITDTSFSDIGNSPFVSSGGDKKYIVIELRSSGPVYDVQDLLITDEDGRLIAESLISENKALSDYHFIVFLKWGDFDTFWAKAMAFGVGRPHSLQLLVDAKTGKIVKTEEIPADETADWKTYRNEKYGYETDYSDDWKIVEAKPRVGDKVEWTGDILIGDEVQKVTFVEENYGFWPGSFEIRVLSNPDKLSIKDWWEKELKESDEWQKECLKENPSCPSLRDALISQEEMLFKNQVALKTSVFAFDHSQECIRTEKNHHIYTLCYDDSKANDDNYIKHSEIYHQIISTFKFLE